MTQMTTLERTRPRRVPVAEPAMPTAQPAPAARRPATLLRVLGALTLLVVGAVHLEQYIAVHFSVVPVIGPLFLLNFIGATAMGLLLLLPLDRSRHGRVLGGLLALGGAGLAATSFVFVFVSEHATLFGFRDYGYRPAILIALAAEAAAVLVLGAFLPAALRRR
jgi:hypothetical protein